jgi:apolipoprotein D and lipocalin family protein
LTGQRSILLSWALALAGCSSSHPPLKMVPHVDLERFMGDWYVIANIPTLIEKGAHNAVESYQMNPDGTIATTFTYRADRFDGPIKRYEPTGFILDNTSNAVWGMRFIWPIKADYRIVYLDPDYQRTIIGREARDYVWIMARQPHLSEGAFRELVQMVESQGYDVSQLQRVPQRWPATPPESGTATDRSE